MAKRWRRWALGPALALLAAGAAAAAAAAAAPQGGFWSDPATGLAIGGFDPVAYFVDGAPRQGIATNEYAWAGAAFRFVSAANRAAFAADPDVYAPQFGGHDALRAAAGAAVEGNPRIWLIEGDRLFLFATRDNRERWQDTPPALKQGAPAQSGASGRGGQGPLPQTTKPGLR